MTLKNLMNSSSSYLMSMLCKSSTNKYMIMAKKCYRQDYEKYDKTSRRPARCAW